MKRIFLLLVMAMLFVYSTSAQLPKHAVGLRYNAVYGLGTEICYQRGLTSENRLEFDFGYHSRYEYISGLRQDYNSWALTGLYHWVWKLKDNLNWYAGGGSKLGTWSSRQKYDSRYKNGIFLVAAGNAGIEYSFPASIQFSLDARPEVGLYNQGSGINIGFSVRYQFR